jgi:hypothetical protein
MITAISFGITGIAEARDNNRDDRGYRDRTSVQTKEKVRDRRTDGNRPEARRNDSAGRFAAKVDRRQEIQLARIQDGRRSGALTKREAQKLKKTQRKIDRMEYRFAQDGHIDKRERRKLNKALERSSHRIYKLKHNDAYRGNRGQAYKHGHGAGRNWIGGYSSHEPVYQSDSGYQPAVTYSETVDLLFDGITLSWNTTRQF